MNTRILKLTALAGAAMMLAGCAGSAGATTQEAAEITGGVFRLCGVPAGTRVTVAAELPDGRRSAPVDVVVPPSGVAARDLVVRRPR